jgi:hypothetical protein
MGAWSLSETSSAQYPCTLMPSPARPIKLTIIWSRLYSRTVCRPWGAGCYASRGDCRGLRPDPRPGSRFHPDPGHADRVIQTTGQLPAPRPRTSPLRVRPGRRAGWRTRSSPSNAPPRDEHYEGRRFYDAPRLACGSVNFIYSPTPARGSPASDRLSPELQQSAALAGELRASLTGPGQDT